MYIRKHSMVTESYKKIIFGFVAATVVLVVVILYFSASRAAIKIVPEETLIESDMAIDVATDGGVGSADSFQGMLFETEVAGAGEGEATGTQILEGNTIGKVTLINKRAEAQTLVKTTRLLAQDGILLRLSNRVDVPAGGQIDVDVYADNPNAFTELQPTTFIIPGLWEGLQKQVYAESKGALKSTGKSAKSIQAVDFTKAKDDLTEKLYAQAIEEFKKQTTNKNYIMLVVSKQVLEEKFSAEVGKVVDSFDVSMKLRAVLVGLDQEKLVNLAGERLKAVVPEGQSLANLDMTKFDYRIESFDEARKTAKVKAHLVGTAVIKADNPIFDKEKLSGLSPKAVELYLSNFKGIKSVKTELSPFWVKKIPKMKDHINIVIENPAK